MNPGKLYASGRGRYGWPVSVPSYGVDLVDSVLQETTPRSVLDPFCGYGSVNLACSLMGIRSTGLDANPFCTSIAKAKTADFADDGRAEVGYACARCIDNVFWEDEKYDPPWMAGTFSYGDRQSDYLRRLRHQSENERDPAVRQFMMLAFYRTLADVHETDEGSFDDSVGNDVYGRAVEEMRDEIGPRLSASARILLCDSRDIPCPARGYYDSVISFLPLPSVSPQPPEVRTCMQWSGLFGSPGDVERTDSWMIGTPVGTVSSYMRGWEPDGDAPLTPGAEEVVAAVKERDARDSAFLRRYFSDMCQYFESSKCVMRSVKRASYFVGTTQVDGVHVPTDELVPAAAEAAGLRVLDVEKVRVRDARRDLCDHLVTVGPMD